MRRRFLVFTSSGRCLAPRQLSLSSGRCPKSLKRKRSKELDTFNKADFLCLCKGHKINKEHKVSL